MTRSTRKPDVRPCVPTVVLPESFEAEKYLLTRKLRLRADDARWFVGTIVRKTARGECDRRGFVRLRAEYLMQIMCSASYAAVIGELLFWDVIERDRFIVGLKPFGYRLSPRFATDGHKRLAITDPRLIARIDLHREKVMSVQKSRAKPVHYELGKRQHWLEIDGEAARSFLLNRPNVTTFDVQQILVDDIETGNYRWSVGRFGRMSNNITTLKREARTHLYANGRKLTSIDIACSQPALLASRISKHPQRASKYDSAENCLFCNNPSSFPALDDSTKLFCDLVSSGELYDYLMTFLPGMNRECVKKRLLTDVFAKKKRNPRGDEYPSPIEDEFRERFPYVYRYIRKVNRDGFEHQNLIRLLQQDESALVIELVAWDLINRHPDLFLITLHDAIFTTLGNEQKVFDAFGRAFDCVGTQMRLKLGA